MTSKELLLRVSYDVPAEPTRLEHLPRPVVQVLNLERKMTQVSNPTIQNTLSTTLSGASGSPSGTKYSRSAQHTKIWELESKLTLSAFEVVHEMQNARRLNVLSYSDFTAFPPRQNELQAATEHGDLPTLYNTKIILAEALLESIEPDSKQSQERY